MLAVQYTQRGVPHEVLSVVAVPLPEPGPGTVRVRVLARAINPMDLLIVRGLYPLRPELPATPGSEGVGEVDAVGDPSLSPWLGRRVALPIRSGTWREALCVDPAELAVLPHAADPIQQAGPSINGPTAAALLEGVPAGAWVLQSCAAGGVGQAVSQLARLRGIRTVGVVRSPARADVVRAAGADAVVVDGERLRRRVREATGGAPIIRALDGVGGACAGRLARCVGDGGVVVHYGAMSRQPPELGVADAIFRGVRLEGFWLNRWNRDAGPERARQLVESVADARLRVEIDRAYPLAQLHDALAAAQRPGRRGKVVLTSLR